MTQLKVRDRYDWVVIGSHPGALLSAILAAKQGLSVLVLPAGPTATLSHSQVGHPLDPESNFILGLGRGDSKSGLLNHCLVQAGLLPSEIQSIRSKEAQTSVITPTHRMTIADPKGLEGELLREFGSRWVESTGLLTALKSHAEEVDDFWLGLPDRYKLKGENRKKRPKVPPVEKQLDTLGKKIGRSFKGLRERSPEIKNGFAAAWNGIIGPAGEAPLRAELLHSLALARTAGCFRGGISAYRSFLTKLAQRLGAQVPQDTECSQIFIERGKLVGVQMSQHSNMIAVGGGILGCSLEHARSITSETSSFFHRKLKSAPRCRGWKFTLALTVGSEAVPGLATRRLIWQEPDSPLLEIEHCDPAEYGHPIPGARLIFARTYLPFTSESLDPGYQRLVSARIFKQLTELFPFIEFHVIKIHPDFRASEEKAIEEIRETYPFMSLDGIPENLRSYEEGVGLSAGVAGLFVGTGEAYPRLGTLGPSVAAIESVAWLAEKHGLSGPLN